MDWQDVAIGLGVSIGIALAVAQLLAWATRYALTAASGNGGASPEAQPAIRRPVLVIRAVFFVATLAVIVRPVMAMFGVEFAHGVSLEGLTAWVFQEGLRILIIAVLAYVTVRLAGGAVAQFEDVARQRAADGAGSQEAVARFRTIGRLATQAVAVLIWGGAIMMMLRELGMDITPLLAGAGIGGLAIGFGAQHLVRDIISGIFFILEDQVHVGDVVKANDTAGLVEAVNLRTLVLRDLSGTVHVVPNGSISMLSNLTKEYSYAVLDVGVAYKEDTDRVSAVLRDVAYGLQAEPEFGALILDPLEILGVDQFADSAVVIKVRLKTQPLQQWKVGREFRRRIKKAFDAEGIEIPFPHLSLYFGQASDPVVVRQQEGTPRAAVDHSGRRGGHNTTP